MFASGVVILRKRRFGYTRGVLGFTFLVSALLRGRGLSSFFICSMFFLSLGGGGWGGDVNVLCDC